MSYANVIAKPKNLTKKLQFAISDNEGYYKLLFKKVDTVTISISYLGFSTINYDFIALKSETKNFMLKPSNETLDEIVIEAPVIVRGDTIIYNTNKFVTGEERKLKNILKKLPGVEVSSNGEVAVQGKKVTKMLVDGKKFFGGNSKLAVDNIPANAVDGVQVIDNYNEIAFLKELTDSNEMAMNIKLKKDKKSFVFGDIELGRGNEEFFKTHSNLFYYSPKININFIGNINNIGEKTFTYNDYLSFQSSINPVFGDKFNWGGDDFSQFLKDKDLVESNQKFAALNITKSPSSKLSLSGFVIFSKANTRDEFQTQNDYSIFSEFRENKSVSNKLTGIGKYSLEYSPSENERWLSNTEIKINQNEIDNNIVSLTMNNKDNIFTNRQIKNLKAKQILEWHKRYSSKHTLSTVVSYNYLLNKRPSLWITNDNILTDLIPIIPNQNILVLDQKQKSQKHNIGFIFKHFWEINDRNHFYTTFGNDHLSHFFFTNDQQILDNGSINSFEGDSFNNDLIFTLNDLFLELNYKFRTGIFTLNQGGEIHHYSWRADQASLFSKNKFIFLPKISVKIQFNKSKKVQFDYRLRTTFPDANKFSNSFYLSSFNSVFRGNEILDNNLFHNATIYYSRFSLYRGLIMNVHLNYNKQTRGIQNAVEFDGVNQFLSPRMLDNLSESVKVRGSIYKKINNIRYRFDGNVSKSSFLQETNNSFQVNEKSDYSYTLGVETLYKNFPKINFGHKKTLGNFRSSNITSKFVTNESFLTIDHNFWKGFVISFDYRSYDFTNRALNQRNKYEIANFTLLYEKENKALTYKISSNNLFNTKFKRRSSFSQYLISDTKIFILPRVIMLGISYNL